MFSKVDKTFELWLLLDEARDAIYNARSKELSKYDLSVREVAIIRAIHAIGEEATPAKIARWVYRKPHTVKSILTRMQKKGILKLNKDKKVKNIVRIKITEEGEKTYKDASKLISIHRIFKKIDENNWDELEIFLTRIRDAALKQTGDSINRNAMKNT